MASRLDRKFVLLLLLPSYVTCDTYGAPYAPTYDSYSAPVYKPNYATTNTHTHHHQDPAVQHVHNHYYHQAPQYQTVPVHYAPAYGYSLPPGYGGYGDEYVKRKEIVKGALLLGAGVVKGALLTTLIQSAANNANAGK